jgi:hypothetical protein
VELWDNKVWSGCAGNIDQSLAFKTRFNHDSFQKKFELQEPSPLTVLRHGVLSRWQRNVFLDLKAYMLERFGQSWVDRISMSWVGSKVRDVLNRVCQASFREWKDGSALIFWRWPRSQQDAACNGYLVWVLDELPEYRRRQRREADPVFQAQIASKLQAVRGKRYIQRGTV